MTELGPTFCLLSKKLGILTEFSAPYSESFQFRSPKPWKTLTQKSEPDTYSSISWMKMMEHGGALLNLLDEALGPLSGRVVLLEDCVETSAAFVLHHLLKRSLSVHSSNVVVFVAFSQPFSHYDRILRKLVLSLSLSQTRTRIFGLYVLCVCWCSDTI